ncbi:MAG: hypothetical protein NVSMB57_05140 [Actinomycetota bacterium]
MFLKTPHLYDEIYGRIKDYAAESAHAIRLIEDRNPGAQTLLDVACGTGQHLAHLSKRFAAEGIDLDPALLEIASKRNPEVPLHVGDMTSFELGRTFDVDTGLFSAIGYVVTVERLGLAIQRMAAHLNPGGVLLIEPWLTPGVVEPRNIHASFIDDPELKVARISRIVVEGRVSNVEFEYLIGTPDGISHEHETHVTGLFTRDEHLDALNDAGLTATFDEEGLFRGRGIYIATSAA